MELTDKENKIISKLSSTAGIPENTIKTVFQTFFALIAREQMEGNKEFSIPYLMDLKIDFSIIEKNRQYILQEKLSVNASKNLHEVLVQTYNNNDQWQEEFFPSLYEKVFGRLFDVKKQFEEEELVENFIYG